jgi:hypothetical protein
MRVTARLSSLIRASTFERVMQKNANSHSLSVKMRRRVNRLRYTLFENRHKRRWETVDRAAIAAEVEQKLKLDNHFWLFCLGVNNSGTTLIHELLRNHPEVRALPREGHRCTDALPDPTEHDVGRVWAKVMHEFRMDENSDPGPALQAKYDWLFYAGSRPGILLEKSPPNSVRSRWLQANFQPARFLCLFRDGYAVSEGIRRRANVDIAEAANHWASVNRVLLDDMEKLDRTLSLKYEDLCDNPEPALQKLEQFLDLKVGIDRSIVTNPMRARNLENTKKPLENFNAKSWDNLSSEDRAIINDVAGDVIDRLGYARLT